MSHEQENLLIYFVFSPGKEGKKQKKGICHRPLKKIVGESRAAARLGKYNHSTSEKGRLAVLVRLSPPPTLSPAAAAVAAAAGRMKARARRRRAKFHFFFCGTRFRGFGWEKSRAPPFVVRKCYGGFPWDVEARE